MSSSRVLLGAHQAPQPGVDLDCLGHDRSLAEQAGPAVELPAEISEVVLGPEDDTDLTEVEAEELLQLADAQQPRHVSRGVAPRPRRCARSGASRPSSS